jgi:hypothetical protein
LVQTFAIEGQGLDAGVTAVTTASVMSMAGLPSRTDSRSIRIEQVLAW